MLNRWPLTTRIFGAVALLGTSGVLACAAVGAATTADSIIPATEAGSCMSAAEIDLIHWRTSTEPGATTPGAWCDAVGPALRLEGNGPGELEGNGAAAPLDELVVATWNVHVGGGDLLGFVQDLKSGALTGKPVGDFVLLLQEAYRAGDDVPTPDAKRRLTERIDVGPPTGERVDVTQVARHLAVHAFYAPSMPNGSGADVAEDRGNAILSTLPLSDLSAIELPFEVQRRVAVAATVAGMTSAGTTWTLRIASGHLDTRSRWSRFLDSFGNGRARQASALGAWLDGDAVILGADLNTWSLGFLENALDILYARFPETPRGAEPTYSAAGVLGRRLDHLLYRLPGGRVEVHRVASRYGSDHHPLVGVVRLPGAAAGAAADGSRVRTATR